MPLVRDGNQSFLASSVATSCHKVTDCSFATDFRSSIGFNCPVAETCNKLVSVFQHQSMDPPPVGLLRSPFTCLGALLFAWELRH